MLVHLSACLYICVRMCVCMLSTHLIIIRLSTQSHSRKSELSAVWVGCVARSSLLNSVCLSVCLSGYVWVVCGVV